MSASDGYRSQTFALALHYLRGDMEGIDATVKGVDVPEAFKIIGLLAELAGHDRAIRLLSTLTEKYAIREMLGDDDA